MNADDAQMLAGQHGAIVEHFLSPQGKVIWRVKFIDTLAAEYFCLILIDEGMDQVGLISLGRVLLIFDKDG